MPRVGGYFAAGDGVTDDTVAIQNALNDGAPLNVPAGTYLIASGPLNVSKSGTRLTGAGIGQTTFTTSTASQDLVQITAGMTRLAFQGVTFQNTSSAGHLFTPLGSCNTSQWFDVQCIQNNPAASIWNGGDFGFIDNLWLDCVLTHNGNTTVPSFNLVTNTNGANQNTWMRCQCNHVAGATATFFNVERDNAGAYNYGNVFRDLTFEICNGGIISLLSANGCLIDNCKWYDGTTSTANLIVIGAGSGGQASRSNTIRNYQRVSGALGASLNDIQLQSGGKAIATTIQDSNQSSGAGITIDLGSNQRGMMIGCENATVTNQHQSQIIIDRGRLVAETVQVLVTAGAPTDGSFNVTPGNGALAVDSTDNKLYCRIGGAWKGVVVA